MTNIFMADLWGVDMGFWIGMAVCLAVVIVMNVVYWNFPDKSRKKNGKGKKTKDE